MLNDDSAIIYLRFSETHAPLVEMRVRVLPNTIQVEYSLRKNPTSIYIQKHTQYFDFGDDSPGLDRLWNGQSWDFAMLDALSGLCEVDNE